MDLTDVLARLHDIEYRGDDATNPPDGAEAAIKGLRALIADVEAALGLSEDERTSPARAMEIGEVARMGSAADGHLIREDANTWLHARSTFATEYSLDADEADEVLRGRGRREASP